MTKTLVYRKCKRCGKTVYRFPKEDNVSDVVKGAEIALHMITCDTERYNALISEFFLGIKE